jgi:hypothetical protein
LGGVYLKLGHLSGAVAWLDKSVHLWENLKAPAALQARKQTELARAKKNLALSRSEAAKQ